MAETKPTNVEFYQDANGVKPAARELNNITDPLAKAAIKERIRFIEKNGGFGDIRSLKNANGLSELRFDIGKGYRVYGKIIKGQFAVFAIGNKPSQDADIAAAVGRSKDLEKGIGTLTASAKIAVANGAAEEINQIKDPKAAAAIRDRLITAQNTGSLGTAKTGANGVAALEVEGVKGYQVYAKMDQGKLVVLGAGTDATRAADLARAASRARSLEESAEATTASLHLVTTAERAGGRYIPVIGPIIVGATVLVLTGSTSQASAATMETAVPGSSDGFKGIRDPQARTTDRILDGLDTGTGAVFFGAGAVAVGSTATGIGAPVGAGACLASSVAGISNIGVQLLRDVAYNAGLADKPGPITSMAQGIADFEKRADASNSADMAMHRALLPLSAVASTLMHSNEIHGKVSKETGLAIYHFSNIRSQATQTRVENGAEFTRTLAKELLDKGPGGDAIRKALGPSIQKAGSTPEQYAQALNNYANSLSAVDETLKHTSPDNYAQVVQQSAEQLLIPPQQQTIQAQTPPASPAQKSSPPAKSDPTPPAHLATGKGAARQALISTHYAVQSHQPSQSDHRQVPVAKPQPIMPHDRLPGECPD